MRSRATRPLAAAAAVCAAAALALAACSTPSATTPTSAPTTSTTAPSRPLPVVLTAATPKGWIPVDLGDAQLSVPSTFDVAYPGQDICEVVPTGTAGLLLVNPGRVSAVCPPPAPGTRTLVRIIPVRRVPAAFAHKTPPSARNGVRVLMGSSAATGITEYAPSLHVEVVAEGPMARRVAQTLTRSPRAVVLAPGPAPAVPSGWHLVRWGGVEISVPPSWPVRHTDWALPGIAGVCGGVGGVVLSAGVTLSNDTRNPAVINCPLALFRPAPGRKPATGLVIDSGKTGGIEHFPWEPASRCLHINGLSACPARTPDYSVVVLEVTVPGRKLPTIVSVGFAGNGMVARRILYSLRAETRSSLASAHTLCAVASQVDRLVVRRTDAFPQNHVRFSFPRQVTVSDAARARSAARALCALPRMPSGTFHCPADLGIDYHLAFSTEHRSFRAVTVSATGCEEVSGFAGTRWVARTPRFWRELGQAMGLPNADQHTFAGSMPG